MRIAVIGAGIAGLAAGAGLQRGGHEVVIYEQREDPSPIGAGLTLFGNAFAALDLLGLGDAVRDVSSDAIAAMRAGQRTPSGRWMLTMPKAAMASMRSLHRNQLHRALGGALKPGTVRVATTAAVCPDGSPTVAANGMEEDFDLVVVADGIRSRNRKSMGLDTGIRYAGYVAWRGVTSRPVDLRGEAGETWGRGRIFGIVPLPDGRVYWFATMSAPEHSSFVDDRGTLLEMFSAWHEPIAECIVATEGEAVLRHDVHDLTSPLRAFVRGSTVFLGDAAHAMTPNLGQGAGQGLEDAATLTALLRGTRIDDLPSALEQYDRLRRPRTGSMLLRSRSAARLAQASGLTAALRDVGLTVAPGRVMGAMSRSVQNWAPPTT